MKMKDLQLESPKPPASPDSSSSSSSSSSSALSSISHLTHHTLKQLLQCCDFNCCHGSHRAHPHSHESLPVGSGAPKGIRLSSLNTEAQEFKKFPTSDNKKGKDNSLQSSVLLGVLLWCWYRCWYRYRILNSCSLSSRLC